MIFLSHNYNDKHLVGVIAQRLGLIFGSDNIFYDEWSIQPGDSIISKMNEGLTKCKFFFFFVSQNSLASSMVTLEWQSALTRYNQGIKFIPVIIEKCQIPYIIKNILYIDLVTNGLEVAFRQIVDVINGNNTYRRAQINFCNLHAYINKISSNDNVVTIKAEYYLEPHSRYLLQVDNNENELEWHLPEIDLCSSEFNKNMRDSNGKLYNCIFIECFTPTSPDFPIVINLRAKENFSINLQRILHANSRQSFSSIPMHIQTQWF